MGDLRVGGHMFRARAYRKEQTATEAGDADATTTASLHGALHDWPTLQTAQSHATSALGRVQESALTEADSLDDICDQIRQLRYSITMPPAGGDQEMSLAVPSSLDFDASISADVCKCGNVFATDSVFCRRCGEPRPLVLRRRSPTYTPSLSPSPRQEFRHISAAEDSAVFGSSQLTSQFDESIGGAQSSRGQPPDRDPVGGVQWEPLARGDPASSSLSAPHVPLSGSSGGAVPPMVVRSPPPRDGRNSSDYAAGGASSRPSRLPLTRKTRTLYEERQMERCFQRWAAYSCMTPAHHQMSSSLDKAVVLSSPPVSSSSALRDSHDGSPEEMLQMSTPPRHHSGAAAPVQSPMLASPLVSPSPRKTRVHDCFRAWRRAYAAKRADEIATNVQLLNLQVNGQLKGALGRWRRRTEERKLAAARDLNVTAVLKRQALRWWSRHARDTSERLSFNHQARALMRIYLLRRATRQWSTRTTGCSRWRSFYTLQGGRILRVAWRLWLEVHDYWLRKRADAAAHSLILQCAFRRSALRFWSALAEDNAWLRQRMESARQQLLERAKRRTLQELLQAARASQGRDADLTSATLKRRRSRQLAALRLWCRWSTKRARRRRTLLEHRRNRVQPRLSCVVLQMWLSVVRREQRHAAALQKAGIVMALSLKSRTFAYWLTVLNSKAMAAAKLRSLAAAMLNLFAGCSFLEWRAAVVEIRHERARETVAERHRRMLFQLRFFRLFRDGLLLERYEARQEHRATAHWSSACTRQLWRLWQGNALRAKRHRYLEREAGLREVRAVSRRSFLWWRSGCLAIRHARQKESRMHSRRAALCLRTAWTKWARYLAHRVHKRYTQRVQACRALVDSMRQRRRLQMWLSSLQASRHRQKKRQTGAYRVQRAFFAWGWARLQVRRRCRRIGVALQAGLQRRVISGLRGYLMAAAHKAARGRQWVLLRSLGLWRAVHEQRQREEKERIATAQWSQQRRGVIGALAVLRSNMLRRREMRLRLSILISALDIVARRSKEEAQAQGLEAFWHNVEHGRSVDIATLVMQVFRQKELCFKSWMQFCEQKSHKRRVLDVVFKYREVRLMRNTLQCWYMAHTRMCNVAESVLQWAAALMTDRAYGALWAWRRHVLSRVNCRRGLQEFRSRKTLAILAGWQHGAQEKRGASNLLLMAFLGRQRAILKGWLQYAAHRSAERRRHVIATQAVVTSRQRQVIDRWCTAGRWRRLGDVAEAWDARIKRKYFLVEVLRSWFDAIANYKKGRALAKQLLTSRTAWHLRHWSLLMQTSHARPRSLLREGFAWWLSSCERVWQLKRTTRRIPLQGALRQLRRNAREQLRQRRQQEQRRDTLWRSYKRGTETTWFRWWRKWALNIQRKAKSWRKPEEFAQSQCRRELKKAIGSLRSWAQKRRAMKTRETEALKKATKLHSKKWKEVIDLWIVAAKDHKAVRFRNSREVAAFVQGGESTALAAFVLRTWAEHSRRRLGTRGSTRLVQSKLFALRRARIFDQWAKVYEHESSTFYATQILRRSKYSRMLAAWFRIAMFQKRFAVHVSHVQVLQDTQLLRACFQMWDKCLHEHRCIAAVWLDRWRHWSSALMVAWKSYVRKRQTLRAGLQDLRAGTLSMRGRRKAKLMRIYCFSTLLRRSFMGFVERMHKVMLLKRRQHDLAARVAEGRTLRRLSSWVICARASHRDAIPCGGLGRVLQAWLAAHHECLRQARGITSISKRRTLAVAALLIPPWLELALENRPLRLAVEAARGNCQRGRASRTVTFWRGWSAQRHRHRGVVLGHRRRWNPRLVLPCLALWWREARHNRLEVHIMSNSLRSSILVHWRAWCALVALARNHRSSGLALASQKETRYLRLLLTAWAASARRSLGVRKLVGCVDRAERRWIDERSWRRRVDSDAVLRAMFTRFATAFDQQRAHLLSAAEVLSAAQEEALRTLVSLIWERQQLSVALGALKGYRQPWFLGCWMGGAAALLPEDSPYYEQTQMRLEAMVARLEEEWSPDRAVSLFSALYAEGSLSDDLGALNAAGQQPDMQQRLMMWQALADLMVVHHPGWPGRSVPAEGPASFPGLRPPQSYLPRDSHVDYYRSLPPTYSMLQASSPRCSPTAGAAAALASQMMLPLAPNVQCLIGTSSSWTPPLGAQSLPGASLGSSSAAAVPRMSLAEACAWCGNIFKAESLYCRKCGRRRQALSGPPPEAVPAIDVQAVIRQEALAMQGNALEDGLHRPLDPGGYHRRRGGGVSCSNEVLPGGAGAGGGASPRGGVEATPHFGFRSTFAPREPVQTPAAPLGCVIPAA
eukprot:TRINITY_DN35592_c0_g1_i1.p1 TRINITY_DN35592_c0_g1~~TRINITY_DN35592_c0_g1_i1.p1  ORF type:complete len:2292 (+),score=418.32 TRINITY_DN35592_c0_g1_i1:171-7046(+)